MTSLRLATRVIAAVAFGSSAAHATVITAQLVTPQTILPFTLENFGGGNGTGLQSIGSPIVTPDGVTISWYNASSANQSGVYSGSVPGVSSSPFSDNTDYLSAEPSATGTPSGNITLTFSQPQSAFDLLWGSVDLYNVLTFSGGGTSVTIRGGDVESALSNTSFVYGTSSAAVEISGLPLFSTLTVTSTSLRLSSCPVPWCRR